MKLKPTLILAAALLLALGSIGLARNVDLSTVPRRDSVELTIYNSEDLTLVRETRAVTFKRGVNPLQFSWANTLIDPSSVHLRFLDHAEKLDLLDTTYPNDKPQMLYWNVQSEIDGQASVEITYFTSGITWSADYAGLADKAEKTMAVDGFVRVSNNSGEAYEDAHVRLVVGTINLVEKIAHLAHVSEEEVVRLKDETRNALRFESAKKAMQLGDAFDARDDKRKEKEIIKEGLSEYFIFSIEGTETIPSGWSKRMRSLHADAVPMKIQYRYRPAEYGDRLVRMYLLANDKGSKLGDSPLPDGVVRIFRDNGRGGLSYLAAQQIKYIPIGDKIELNLGVDPNVRFELVKLRVWRDNLWLRVAGTNIFRQVGAGGFKLEAKSSVAGWDEHDVYAQRVSNYTATPIEVEIRRSFSGDATFRSRLNPTLQDYRTVQFTAPIEAGKTSDLLYETVYRQGHNAKQSRVTLEAGEAKF